MLVHIRPRIFSPFEHVTLLDVELPEFGLKLRGGEDLTTRRPYPNKRYTVACPKIGRKALDGIYVETAAPVAAFTMIARWAVEAEFIATHRVEYRILDQDFDAVSDSMLFWYGMSAGLGGWESRWPEDAKDAIPCKFEPAMGVLVEYGGRDGDVQDKIDPATGWIIERTQAFRMPTLQRERVLDTCNPYVDRQPPLESAFHAKSAP